ncbi:ANTAR domain-containing protein [Streptomyces venezuelae]|uniref:ANTAR domain-containing response regulator n=1 Tax=Streptomyces venezuelae TaxID=54571 RepID=UPI0034536787
MNSDAASFSSGPRGMEAGCGGQRYLMPFDVQSLRQRVDSSQTRARELVQRAHHASRTAQMQRAERQLRRGGCQLPSRAGAQAPARVQTSPVTAGRPGGAAGRPSGASGRLGGAAAPSVAEVEVEVLRRENAQLQQALVSRPVIDQARGVLMAAGGCSAEEAWEVLVEISQRSNTKLRQVAEMVVASTSGDHLPDSVALQFPALRRFVIGRAAER